jgi:CubicO group peptidase (beta-lactamase class C family)
MVEVEGSCDQRFEPVAEAFARNFTDFDEVGAAVAVAMDGELVVDLWARHMSGERDRPWGRDTIVNCASTTKGLVGLCANMLVDRGLLDVDRPVADYWPEFAAAGKEAVPVRWLLDQRAGLLMIDGLTSPDDLLDWERVVTALAAQVPQFEPGSTHSYHAITFGYLVGEVIRRVSGRTVGTLLREEVTGPLGVDFFIGTPAEADDRVADQVVAPELQILTLAIPHDAIAYRRAEVPSGNGHGNARALASIYGVLATGGGDLLSAATLADATSYEITGPWFGRPDGGLAETRFTRGFVLNSSASYMGPNAGAFGFSGFGGSIGFADPTARVGFGYTPNAQLTLPAGRDTRSGRLVDALYGCL